jgi:hypothetical protein
MQQIVEPLRRNWGGRGWEEEDQPSQERETPAIHRLALKRP